jgi:hypothetical protein
MIVAYATGAVSGVEVRRTACRGHRQRADGAVIQHIRGQDVINLVLVLKPSGRDGTARTEYVYYQSGGTRYLLKMGVGIQGSMATSTAAEVKARPALLANMKLYQRSALAGPRSAPAMT